ncbi:MAG: helix-turn-helix transcriptional regulator [Lachnospiraceae bacterium]|nr:helix-turn-helix transcriptional regulator [Lachnospiraceae bacterium]
MAIRICLDEVLRECHMTSKELCKWVGITEANLSVLRSGKAKGVRFGTLNKICYYLQCEVGDILRFDGKLEEEGTGEESLLPDP